MRKKADDVEFVINAREPSLGVGVQIKNTAEGRVFRFARTEGERTFKETYCKLYIKPAVIVPDSVKDKLFPPPPPPIAATPRSTHAELEAQIRARPDEEPPYLVYADWLQQQRDPRGDLITIQHQRAATPGNRALATAEKGLLATHANYFVPVGLAEALAVPRRGSSAVARCEVTWRNGYFQRVRLAKDASAAQRYLDISEIAAATLAHPSAKFLRALVLGPLGTPTYSYNAIVGAIAKNHHPLLDELVIGDFTSSDIELGYTRAGDLGPMLRATPRLSKLVVKAGSLRITGKHVHERLADLSIETEGLEWTPALVARFPGLRRLALRGTIGTRGIFEALLMSPVLEQLESLDLTNGDLGDDDVRWLMKHRDRFAHLRLQIDTGNVSPLFQRWLASTANITTRRNRFQISERDVIELTPDKISMQRARQIANPTKWMALGYDPRRDTVWGEYEGRDSYYVFAALRDEASGCDCASPKQPCKHALALRLLAAHQHGFPERPMPNALVRNASRERPVYASTWE